jgi:hypothetical protein
MRAVSLRVLAPLLVTALTAVTVAACASSPRPAPAACTPADLQVTVVYIQGATQHGIYGAPAGSRGLERATISGSTDVNGNCGRLGSGVLKLAARTSRESQGLLAASHQDAGRRIWAFCVP